VHASAFLVPEAPIADFKPVCLKFIELRSFGIFLLYPSKLASVGILAK
jgi:hypothetical protein